MTADLQALLARVEVSTGADREIDAALWKALLPKAYRTATGSASGLRPRGMDLAEWEASWAPNAAARYTASLDAALALAERLFPSAYHWIIRNALDKWQHKGGDRSAFARQVLAALLKALISQTQPEPTPWPPPPSTSKSS